MLHDFRRAILGRPGADEDIEMVQESIRAAGRVGIPIVEYNWYALRAMGGYYEEPGRGGSRLAAHDYDRSRTCPCSTTSARTARPTCGRATSGS